MFLFWFRAACKLQLVSYMYSPEHGVQSLSDVPFCACFNNNSKTNGYLKSSRHSAGKSKVVDQEVGVVYMWVCQEVCVANYKCKSWLFYDLAFIYATTLPDFTFWKHASYHWQATTLIVHIFSICHFVHILSITQSYTHLMATRPIIGNWKVVRPGSRYI